MRHDLSRISLLRSLEHWLSTPMGLIRTLIIIYLGSLNLLAHLVLARGTVTLRVLLRSAHVDDRVLQGPLVVGPGNSLCLQEALQLGVLLVRLSSLLLQRVAALLQCNDVGLNECSSSVTDIVG